MYAQDEFSSRRAKQREEDFDREHYGRAELGESTGRKSP